MTFIGISGTPGVGKTEVCRKLEGRGHTVVYLAKLVKKHPEFVCGTDKTRKVKEVDVNRIKKFIKKEYCDMPLVFIDSHFSHLLSVDLVIVIRCSPSVLEHRLERRKYSARKTRENIEAEAIDVITIESVGLYGKDKVFEIDTTGATVDQTADAVIKIVEHRDRKYAPGKIDWSEEVLKWY
jgi:adenylate kinase